MLHVFPKSRATTVKRVHCPSVPLPFPPSNQTQNQGKGVKEGAHINHLLLALGNCIEALSGKGGAAPSLSIFKTANSCGCWRYRTPWVNEELGVLVAGITAQISSQEMVTECLHVLSLSGLEHSFGVSSGLCCTVRAWQVSSYFYNLTAFECFISSVRFGWNWPINLGVIGAGGRVTESDGAVISHLSLRKSERSRAHFLLHWLFYGSFTTLFTNLSSRVGAELPLTLPDRCVL